MKWEATTQTAASTVERRTILGSSNSVDFKLPATPQSRILTVFLHGCKMFVIQVESQSHCVPLSGKTGVN